MNLPTQPRRSAGVAGATRRLGWWAAVGPGVYLVCYAVAIGLGAQFDSSPRESFWQFIPAAELDADPLAALWYFHAQPPAVNVPFALTDSLGAVAAPMEQLALLAVGIGVVWVVGDLVLVWTASRAAAVGASVLAALVPATTFYALWLYPTLSIAVLLGLTLWGLARARTDGGWVPLVVSAAAVTGLFLVRATVAWPIALFWLGLVAWETIRRTRPGAAPPGAARTGIVRGAVVVCAAVVAVFTVKNVLLFGAPTQSSWAAENYANVLLNVLSDDEEAAIAATDPCLAELVSVGTFKAIDQYPICLADAPRLGPAVRTAVLDEPRWRNGTVNYNHRDRLALSEHWSRLVSVSVRRTPTVLVRVLEPTQANGTHHWGSPVLLFGPSTRYVFVKENIGELGAVGRLWVIGLAWVPLAAVLAWIAGVIQALFPVRRRTPEGLTYLCASVLVGGLSAAYLLLEFGENQRFQVEVLYAWIALGVTAVHWLFANRRVRPRRALTGTGP